MQCARAYLHISLYWKGSTIDARNPHALITVDVEDPQVANDVYGQDRLRLSIDVVAKAQRRDIMALWSESKGLLCILLPTGLRSMELPDLRKHSTREYLDLVDLFVGTVGWREDRELTKVTARGNETRTFVDSQTPGAQ